MNAGTIDVKASSQKFGSFMMAGSSVLLRHHKVVTFCFVGIFVGMH